MRKKQEQQKSTKKKKPSKKTMKIVTEQKTGTLHKFYETYKELNTKTNTHAYTKPTYLH